MAVAVEILNKQRQEFDWDLAEAQFSEIANYERAPQKEIYGRSLSTIYRLGVVARKLAAEAAHSPEADQVRIEFYTSVEEGFGTDPKLGGGLEVRDFDARPVIRGKVMAKDLKTAVSDMTYSGLVCAEETAKKDKRFFPQLVRSRWDHENAVISDKMARGETNYNTRIVVSPFPEEAAKESGDEYWRNIGYVPSLRRGFVQLYHSGEEFITGSLSFDGCDKERLRDVFTKYGVEIPENEVTDNWLKYAITDTLSKDQAKALVAEIADLAGDPAYKKNTNTVDVTNKYRAIMDTVFNDSYVHACESLARGYQTPGAQNLILQFADNAGAFNDRYSDALFRMRTNKARFTDDDMVVLHELLVYSTIEMMRALHLKSPKTLDSSSSSYQANQFDGRYLQSLDPQAFQHILGGFGADGARNNRTYSACGLSIGLGDGESLNGGSPQEVYGGQTSSNSTNDSTMRCVSCPACKTFHHEVKKDGGKYYCKNKNCKLAAPALKKTVQVKKTEPPKVVKKSKANKTSTHEYALAA